MENCRPVAGKYWSATHEGGQIFYSICELTTEYVVPLDNGKPGESRGRKAMGLKPAIG